MGEWKKKLFESRYVLLVAAVGLALLLWSPGGNAAGESLSEGEEARVEAILSRMEGVGQAELLLSDCGAVVICQGAEEASVRLALTRAVRCYTGLGADKVEIFKME